MSSRDAGQGASASSRSTPTDPARAARLRDGALRRSRSITKGIAIGSVAAVAAFAAYVSHAFPGHSSTSTGTGSTATSNQSSNSSSGSTATSGDQSSGVTAPANAPTSSSGSAHVVSGST